MARKIISLACLLAASVLMTGCILGANPGTADTGSSEGEDTDTEAVDTSVDAVDTGDTSEEPADTKDTSGGGDVMDTSEPDGTGDDADTDTADGADGGCEGADCHCNYNNSSEGVCSKGIRSSGGGEEEEGETCMAPPDYEMEEQTCDGLDNDCDEKVDEGCKDADADGYCANGMKVSGSPSVCPEGGGDCDDSNSLAYPGATESKCGNDVDLDCDGKTGCDDADCKGKQCQFGGSACLADGSCGETKCNDGKDNDNDGQTDICDSDCPGTCSSGASCSEGTPGVCNETNCRSSSGNEDGDDKQNCADPDCHQKSCGNNFACCKYDGTCKLLGGICRP